MTATTNPAPLEMNPGIRARWVAALRSGDYEQGREQLRGDSGELCCLGVLCELAVADNVIAPSRLSKYEGWVYEERSSDLPWAVMDWAGLNSPNPVPEGEPVSLAELNDGWTSREDTERHEPWTFAQIADVIEGGAR